METFKKIATVLGVAVIGDFGFYFVCVFYNMVAFLFGGDSQNTMAIFTAIIAVVIYLVKSRRQ